MNEQGSAAVETAMVVPAVMMLVALMVAGARVHGVRADVADAAAAGARAASLETSAGAAIRAGRRAAERDLAGTCDPDVVVDAQGFARPVGMPATVRVHVSCPVDLGDVVLPGLPGTLDATAERSQVLDSFRRRS